MSDKRKSNAKITIEMFDDETNDVTVEGDELDIIKALGLMEHLKITLVNKQD